MKVPQSDYDGAERTSPCFVTDLDIRDPKREWGRAVVLAVYAARGGFAAKSHSTSTKYRQLRRLDILRRWSVSRF